MAAAAPLVFCGTAPLPCAALLSGAATALTVLAGSNTKDAASVARAAASQAADAAASVAVTVGVSTAAVRASAAAAAMAAAGQSASAMRSAAQRAVAASSESQAKLEWAVKHATTVMENLRMRLQQEDGDGGNAFDRGHYEHLGPFSDRAAYLPCGNWPYERPNGAEQARLRHDGAIEAKGAAGSSSAEVSSERIQSEQLAHLDDMLQAPGGNNQAFFQAYRSELIKSACGKATPVPGSRTAPPPEREPQPEVLQVTEPSGGERSIEMLAQRSRPLEGPHEALEGEPSDSSSSTPSWLVVISICVVSALTLCLLVICFMRACRGGGGPLLPLKGVMVPAGRLQLQRRSRAPRPLVTAKDVETVIVYDDTLENETPKLSSCFSHIGVQLPPKRCCTASKSVAESVAESSVESA